MAYPTQLQPQGKMRSRLSSAGCLVIFALIFTISSLIIGISFVCAQPFCLPIPLLFASGGIWLLVNNARKVSQVRAFNRLIGMPFVSISNTQLRVGEPCTIDVQIGFTQPGMVTNATLSLILREQAQYTQGTTTSTVTYDNYIATFPLPTGQYLPGQGLQGRWQSAIPPTTGPTFSASNNKLLWYVRLRFDVSSYGTFEEDYSFRVLAIRYP